MAAELGFIIPTYNRPECVEYYLASQMEAFAAREINVVVFDSSENDDTRIVVEAFTAKNPKAAKYLHYDRYEGNKADLRALDKKVFTACQRYMGQYKYLWFSGDGTVFDIALLWGDIQMLMAQDMDYIAVDSTQFNVWKPRADGVEYYTDSCTFFKECGWLLTLLGSNILRCEHIEETAAKYPVLRPDSFAFWIPMAFLRLFSEKPIRAAVVQKRNAYCVNPKRTEAFWMTNRDVLWQWAVTWPEAVDALPGYYNPVKEFVIKEQNRGRLFSLKGFLKLKATGNLPLADVERYRVYFKRVSDVPIWIIWLISRSGEKVLPWLYKAYIAKKQDKERNK